MKGFIFLMLFSQLSLNLMAQDNQILIDEKFNDWTLDNLLIIDAKNDVGSNKIDLDSIWVSNDDNYLFFRIKTGKTINLQENNDLSILIDIDNNTGTGTLVNGIGADFIYNLGNKRGQIDDFGYTRYVHHDDIGLITLPTYASDEFEISINRNSEWYSMNSDIKIVINVDKTNGDSAPDTGGITYSFDNSIQHDYPQYSINEATNSDFRFMSFNVHKDDLFFSETQSKQKRIIKAIAPDIIAFQEIYDHNSGQVAAIVSNIFPNSDWYHSKVLPDIILVSKYPIAQTAYTGGNGFFKLELEDKEVVIVNCHLRCCDLDDERQVEVDRIMAFIRDSKEGITNFSIAENTPILITGDMNFVGSGGQLQTLINGNIENEAAYGNDFLPDWDNSPLEDAKPIATGTPFASTWFNLSSNFTPGRLDYILYTGSVIRKVNSFSLFTEGLSPSELQAFGLSKSDAFDGSDHLACAVDFSFDLTPTSPELIDYNHLSIFPNPMRNQVKIDFSLIDHNQKYSIVIKDIYGRTVRSIAANKKGEFHKQVDISKLISGTYFLEITSTNKRLVKKISIIE